MSLSLCKLGRQPSASLRPSLCQKSSDKLKLYLKKRDEVKIIIPWPCMYSISDDEPGKGRMGLIGCVGLLNVNRLKLEDMSYTVLRIRDVYPGSRILIFTHPGSRMSYLFCSHKFHKIVNYFLFEILKKTIWPNFQRIIELLPKKLSWIWDPGSRGQKGTGSRIRIHNTGPILLLVFDSR
jgi:hypothetical protein